MQITETEQIVFTEKVEKRHFPSSLTYCKIETEALENCYKITENQWVENKDGLQSNIHYKKD